MPPSIFSRARADSATDLAVSAIVRKFTAFRLISPLFVPMQTPEPRHSSARIVSPEVPMRWHVHGTDATTGHDVVLAMDQQEATQAVQAAIAKRILVSHVTRDAGEGLRRMLLPLTSVALVV